MCVCVCVCMCACDNFCRCVPLEDESCVFVLGANLTSPQEFSADAIAVFAKSAQMAGINVSPRCMVSLTYVSCFFAHIPCDSNGGLALRICPEDCIVPDAISLFVCKEVYDLIRSFNNPVGQVIREFNCSNPSSYLASDYSKTECQPIITLS